MRSNKKERRKMKDKRKNRKQRKKEKRKRELVPQACTNRLFPSLPLKFRSVSLKVINFRDRILFLGD